MKQNTRRDCEHRPAAKHDAMNDLPEASVRPACFAGVLLVMAGCELIAPRRGLLVARPWRWTGNLVLVALNIGLARVLLPVTAVEAAVFAGEHGQGLLNFVDWPIWLEFAFALLVFDLAIYLQHVMFHAVPLLWRLHLVHHADLDFDVTTGLRFHTAEILLSAVIKLAVVFLLGPAALAVLVFEVLLNAGAMFNHSNVRLPAPVDRVLRLVFVTPDMHRVHHSVIPAETDSNFGFNLPWWDYLFGTYRAQPRHGHDQMTIGLAEFRDEQRVDRLPGLLLLPFTAGRELSSRTEEDRD